VGTIDVFMRRIIDYAGMFPPANLSFAEAAKNFSEYQSHPHADYLGAFVAPAINLSGEAPSPASALLHGDDILKRGFPAFLRADSIEVDLPAEPRSRFLTLLEESFDGRIFVELNWREPYGVLMDEIARRSARFGVKLRTGGVTPQAIPPSRAIADFLLAAAARRLPMKATAGLHVPVPNQDPAVGARMHGFLNFFSAGLLAYMGRGDREALVHVLDDFSYDDFQFCDGSMRCGTVEFSRGEVEELRSRFLLSFGSCSFLEPIEHLVRHGLT
jgi:hypothetical protein